MFSLYEDAALIIDTCPLSWARAICSVINIIIKGGFGFKAASLLLMLFAYISKQTPASLTLPLCFCGILKHLYIDGAGRVPWWRQCPRKVRGPPALVFCPSFDGLCGNNRDAWHSVRLVPKTAQTLRPGRWTRCELSEHRMMWRRVVDDENVDSGAETAAWVLSPR